MRKFYSLALLFVASVFCSMAYGYTGKEDITSSKLTNPDFSAMTPVARTVRTYAKDLDDNGAGSDGTDLYGMQPVEGWTASNPTDNIKHTTDGDPRDAQAAGIFPVYDALEIEEIENPIGLGGAFYALGEKGKTALGIVAVWGASPVYSQEVTLPAGYYIIVTTLYNYKGTGALTNKIGFASESKNFYSEATGYPEGEWVKDTVLVSLNAETAGKISLGFSQAGGSGAAPHIFIDNVKIYTVDEAEVLAEEIAKAKATLLDLINIGKVYNVDTSASEAVYNNPSATLAQVEAAIEAQTKINESGVTDLSSYFIVNSHFDEDEPVEGGICTYDYDCSKNNIPLTNYSMLPLTGWERSKTDNGAASGVYAIGSKAFLGGVDYKVPDVMSDGSSEGKVLGFVTCWSMSMQYTQAVTLPAGDYTLTMSYYNTGGTTAIVKNLIGFISDEGKEYLSDNLTFPVGQWTKDEIKFTLDEETSGYFSLGYQSAGVGSGSMPHFFTDGISLVYVGSGIDPSMFALKAAVSGGNKILASGEPFYTVTEKALEEAIEAGQKLIDEESTDTEANQAAYEKLSGLVNEANASIAAYKKLDAFYNEGGDFYAAREKYTAEAGYKNTSAALDPLADEIEETGLNDYKLSTDRINEIISSLPTVIKTGVQADWDALVASGEKIAGDGIDISILFTGIGENGNFEGWTTTKGSISVQNGVAEIYNNTPFKASKVIEKLPKGKYTVATKGFYRIGSNDVNIDAYEGGGTTGAYVFAGASKADMQNVASVTFDTSDAYTGLAAAGSVFVINNREGASKIFNDPDYADNYNASVSTVLTKEGDLTFGVTADQLEDANWVTWYQFSICYNGSDISDLQAELIAVTETLNSDAEALSTYSSDYTDDLTSPIETTMGTVYNAALGVVDDAEGLYDEQDEETLINAIDKVKGQLDLVAEIQKLAVENVEAVTKCRDARTALDDFMNNEMSDYNPSQEAINAATTLLNEDASDDAISALTTEEVNALTVSLQDAIAALKIPGGAQDASDANPVDMTAVIANADIEQGATVAWQYTKNGGNGPALASGIEGQSIEFWNNDPASLQFNIWQNISVLPVGTYQLTAQASNSLNGQADPENPGRAFLYAATYTAESDTTYFSSDPVAVQEETCTEKYDTYSVFFTVNEGETVTIGFQTSGKMTARWFVCDNFTLTYFGGESQKEISGNPMEVEGVEAAAEAEIVAIYTASGTPVAQLQKGLNIVKYANGTVKKLFVK